MDLSLNDLPRVANTARGPAASVAELVPGLVADVGKRDRLGQCGNPDAD